jgi:hypothetical protein
MSSEVRSYVSLGIHAGDDSQVLCHHYADRAPILVIDGRGCSFTVSTGGLESTGAAVEFARALARKAQEFADDVERLHAVQHADAGSSSDDGTTKADESKAA